MEKLIDMHMHTIYSDGEMTPLELALLVKESGITTFSITDHDNIAGNIELLKTFNGHEMTFITGIEVSGYIDKGELHILGYGIDLNNQALHDYMNKKHEAAINKVKYMTELLAHRNQFIFTSEELDQLYHPIGDVGRPAIARLMVKHGYVENFREAFTKYLIPLNKEADQVNYKLTEDEVIHLILQAGGVPVLAHPILMERDDLELEEYVIRLIKKGLMGIEVFHSDHSLEYQKKMYDLAIKHNLLYSGGSDYHGPNTKAIVHLGTGIDYNLNIKELSLVNYIKSR